MKRFLSLGLFGLGAVVLAGCPIYPDNSNDRRVCDGQYCYDCPVDYGSLSECTPYGCGSSYDCPSGYSCSSSGACVGGGTGYPVDSGVGSGGACSRPGDCAAGLNCGSDGVCHPGDCTNTGCPSGLVCKLSGGTVQCVSPPGSTDGGADTGPKDSGPDAPFSGCRNDSECPGSGARCLDGECTAPANQCSDGTQCASGSQCVQGTCTPSCDSNKQCPTGYSCDLGKGVCTGNPTPCGGSADAGVTCTGSTTCAQDHCVTPCGPGNTCATGLVCVQGGCVPNQKPQFTCAVEGTQDACAVGSVCIHHSCYIACNPDAGADACKNADKFNVCKSVPTASGSYSVCGSASNLGTDCDPTQGKACASPLVCIDGFCR